MDDIRLSKLRRIKILGKSSNISETRPPPQRRIFVLGNTEVNNDIHRSEGDQGSYVLPTIICDKGKGARKAALSSSSQEPHPHLRPNTSKKSPSEVFGVVKNTLMGTKNDTHSIDGSNTLFQKKAPPFPLSRELLIINVSHRQPSSASSPPRTLRYHGELGETSHDDLAFVGIEGPEEEGDDEKGENGREKQRRIVGRVNGSSKIKYWMAAQKRGNTMILKDEWASLLPALRDLGQNVQEFLDVLTKVVSNHLLGKAWSKWRNVMVLARGGDYRRGLQQILREEAVMLIDSSFNKLRKRHLARSIGLWGRAALQLGRLAGIRHKDDARIIIFRNIIYWWCKRKQRLEMEAARRVLSIRKRMMDEILSFERDSEVLRRVRRCNNERARKEYISSIRLQCWGRRYIARRQADLQRRRKFRSQQRYREWRYQFKSAVAIQRFTRTFVWKRAFEAKIALIIERKERFLLERRSASIIQEGWRKMKDRRNAKLVLMVLRIERGRNFACQIIQKAWRNCMYIRAPVNRRADTRARNQQLRLRHECARFLQNVWSKHHNYEKYLKRRNEERARRKKMPAAASSITCAFRRFQLRRVCESLRWAHLHILRRGMLRLQLNIIRRQKQGRRQQAAIKIQLAWYMKKANEEALARMREKERIADDKRRQREERQRLENRMATRIQHAYHKSLGRYRFRLYWLEKVEALRPKVEAALVIQSKWRRFRANAFLRIRFENRRQKVEMALQESSAKRIQSCYRTYIRRYYASGRLVIRRTLEIKREKELQQKETEIRQAAAFRIQACWKRQGARKTLQKRFAFQKQRFQKQRLHHLQMTKACRIQAQWRRWKGAKTLRVRCRRRAAAQRIQRYIRKWFSRLHLQMRFTLRKKALDVQHELEEQKIKAEEEEKLALALKEKTEKELREKIARSWKLGCNEFGQNYYHNYISGESSWEKPEGWEPRPEEVWVKNMRPDGLIYYYQILTGESRWLPPCVICYGDGRRYCKDCDKCYCVSDYEEVHDASNGVMMQNHKWEGAQKDVEVPQPGEVLCIDCRKKVAKRVCRVCRDPWCDSCFDSIHRAGSLKGHTWISYNESKKGWQVCPGKTAGEIYYFNPSTGVSSFEKPRELMGDDELAEHDKYLNAKIAAERYVARIDALQTEVEKLTYTADLKWAEEVEKQKLINDLKRELEDVKKINKNFWEAVGDRLLPWRIYARSKQKAEDHETYRRRLLKSRKDRAKEKIPEGGGEGGGAKKAATK